MQNRLIPALLIFLGLNLFVTASPAVECANDGGATQSPAPDDNNDSDGTACGSNAQATGGSATAYGAGASATAGDSMAIGYYSIASASYALAFGSDAESHGDYGIAFGYQARTEETALYSTAVGYRAYASQPNTVILGSIPSINFGLQYANVGMGTTNPSQAVDVERSGAAARFQLTSFTANATEAPQYIQRRARGTSAAPTAVQNNDNLGLFSFRGHNGTGMGGSRATITAQAAGNFTDSSTPTRLIFAVAPSGSTAPQQVMVIENGQVKINGQNLNVPDYVFEDDYPLMPLEELQSFIDTRGHLPGIAPAADINANGLDLAGSQLGLLQKVEELTLYTLQQQGALKSLQVENAGLRDELAALQENQARMQVQLLALMDRNKPDVESLARLER